MVFCTDGRVLRSVGHIIDSFSWYCSIVTNIIYLSANYVVFSWSLFPWVPWLKFCIYISLFYPVFTCLFHYGVSCPPCYGVRSSGSARSGYKRTPYGRMDSRQATLCRWETFLGPRHLMPAQSWQPHDSRLMAGPSSFIYLESLDIGGNTEREDVNYLT